MKKTLFALLLLAISTASALRAEEKPQPIMVSTDIIVQFTQAEVWAVLSDVDNWGAWNPKVTAVKHGAGLNVGSELSYKWEEREVSATVEQYKENELFVWRGARSGDDVQMQWQLRPSAPGTSLVSLRCVLTPKASATFQANAGIENQAWMTALQDELAKRLAAKPKPVVKKGKAKAAKAPAAAPAPATKTAKPKAKKAAAAPLSSTAKK